MSRPQAPIADEEEILFMDSEEDTHIDAGGVPASPGDHVVKTGAALCWPTLPGPSNDNRQNNPWRLQSATTDQRPLVQPHKPTVTEPPDNLPADTASKSGKPNVQLQCFDKRGDNSRGDNPVRVTFSDPLRPCAEVQETCLSYGPAGAGPSVSSSREDNKGDDETSPGKYSSLRETGTEEEDEQDSSTELYVPERRMTPANYRREYLCGLFLKYSIFIFNFLFWVAGVVGFGFGYWTLTSKGQIFAGGVYFFLDPAVMLCIVGCTIFIVAFFGFLGALRENVRLLKIFRVCLVLVLFIQVGIGILVFVFYTMPEARESLLSGPETILKDAIKRYHDDEEKRKWVDLIQKEFKCCGMSHNKIGYMDWQLNRYFNCSASNPSAERCAVPVSCCIFEPGDYINVMCGFDTTNKPRSKVLHRINTKGCMRGLADWMRGNESYIGGLLLAFVTPQVLGVVFATLFIKHIVRSRARWRLLRRT
ncbi:tetraspanin-33-like [Haliotis rufescens]|uniref:tetraspanin-33-like n=1 Tax=Haliotis rufescens TaxID=6454 RepID=UPI00201F4592|nr:tetraspanin-33-like [Haliotis rufescens]